MSCDITWWHPGQHMMLMPWVPQLLGMSLRVLLVSHRHVVPQWRIHCLKLFHDCNWYFLTKTARTRASGLVWFHPRTTERELHVGVWARAASWMLKCNMWKGQCACLSISQSVLDTSAVWYSESGMSGGNWILTSWRIASSNSHNSHSKYSAIVLPKILLPPNELPSLL